MPAKGSWKHGVYAWKHGLCRCDICHEAHRLMCERRRRKRGVGPGTNRPFSVTDLLILAEDIPAKEAAERLGRTVSAVYGARSKFRIGLTSQAGKGRRKNADADQSGDPGEPRRDSSDSPASPHGEGECTCQTGSCMQWPMGS